MPAGHSERQKKIHAPPELRGKIPIWKGSTGAPSRRSSNRSAKAHYVSLRGADLYKSVFSQHCVQLPADVRSIFDRLLRNQDQPF